MPNGPASGPLGGAGPLDGVALLDHHCHGVVTTDLDRPGFESLLTEAPGPGGPDRFDSALGLAVRRWCAPVLGLDPHPSPEDYLRRRAELGWAESTRRLLRAGGARTWLVDTGYTAHSLTSPDELADLAGGRAYPVTRLEAVAETVGTGAGAMSSGAVGSAAGAVGGTAGAVGSAAGAGGSAAGWADEVERAVRAEVATGAVGLKTVVAYRCGLAVPAERPSAAAVAHAAGRWLREGGGRIADPVLCAWLVHLGAELSAELGLPLQVHTGFGDPDVRLHRANPALLSDLLAATRHTGAVFMLLHCWPYQRDAGYLAHVFGHVRVDVGLAVPYVGARARAVLAELLELAPFGSVCFSSDGYGLPELHFLGALLWRRALAGLLTDWVADDVLTAHDADRLVSRLAVGNAAAVYPGVDAGLG